MLMAYVELQELKKPLAESHPNLIMPEPKTSKMSIQLEDSLSMTIPLSPNEPYKVAHVGNSLDLKLELTLIKFLKEIGTSSHVSLLNCLEFLGS
jgi:hypothetical protein